MKMLSIKNIYIPPYMSQTN